MLEKTPVLGRMNGYEM